MLNLDEAIKAAKSQPCGPFIITGIIGACRKESNSGKLCPFCFEIEEMFMAEALADKSCHGGSDGCGNCEACD